MSNEEASKDITFKLEGLSCSCEAKVVEKRIKALKGIKTYTINPISNWLKVTYDPSQVSTEEMIKSISKAGVKASPIIKK